MIVTTSSVSVLPEFRCREFKPARAAERAAALWRAPRSGEGRATALPSRGAGLFMTPTTRAADWRANQGQNTVS